MYCLSSTAAVATILAVLLISSVAPAATPATISPLAATPSTVTLIYKFTPGEVLRYQMTTDFKGGSSIAQITGRMSVLVTDTVQSVDLKTGNITLLVRESGLKSTSALNGRPLPMAGAGAPSAAQATRTVTVSPLGAPVLVAADAEADGESDAPVADKPHPASANGSLEVSSASIMPDTDGLGGSGLCQGGPFPNYPVQVGDVWRCASGFGAFASGQEYQKESLVALSRSGGHTVANLGGRSSMTATPKDSGIVDETTHCIGTGSEQFDVTSGTLLAGVNTVTIMSKDPTHAGSGSGSKDAFETSMITTTHMRLIQQTMPQSSGQTR